MEKMNINTISDTNDYKLSNPKILNHFISCLKSTYKKQEIKKKKDKRLMNLFSVKVNKYEDSSSQYKTDDKFKKKKAEVAKNLNKKRRTIINNTKRINDNQAKFINTTKKNSTKNFYSSAGAVDDDTEKRLYKQETNFDSTQKKQIHISEDYEYDYELNSDSTIKEKFLISNEKEYFYDRDYDNRKPLSVINRKNILNEKFKYLKSKFNKQLDKTRQRKNSNNINSSISNNMNLNHHLDFDNKKEIENSQKHNEDYNTKSNFNSKNTNNIRHENKFIKNADKKLNSPYLRCLTFDNSINNSYKSVNSTDKKNPSEHFLNYYLIKQIEDDKELIQYDVDDNNQFKYDDNYRCHYSLDHKSRIIYIKPSPKLLSSISSILNSKIVSRTTNKNISGDRSHISVGTPKKEGQDFDHNKIVEKLRNLERARGEKEMENILRKNNYSSESENGSEKDN